MEPADDPVWADLTATAARLSALSTDTVEVWAYRRGVLRVTEGLEAGDRWVSGLRYPVRRRWRFGTRWSDAGSIDAAAGEIAELLRRRPDLA